MTLPLFESYREIVLSQGTIVKISAHRYDDLMQWNWFANGRGRRIYASRYEGSRPNRKMVRMHRYIMGLGDFSQDRRQVDHIDGDSLNNTDQNLRIVDACQNSWNRGPDSTNTSGFKGVYLEKSTGLWWASITARGKRKFLGRFKTQEEAHSAYCKAAKELHGEYTK